jgi:hypothetical protein
VQGYTINNGGFVRTLVNEFEDPDIAGDGIAIKQLEDLIRNCNLQLEAITNESKELKEAGESEIDY